MWVRREPEEIKRYKRNKWLDPKLPLIFGFMAFVLLAIIIKMGIRTWEVYDTPISWDLFFQKGILRAFTFGAAASLVAYIGQLISKRPSKQIPQLFCIKCEKIRNGKDDSRFCGCGGEFVSSDDVKWVENGTQAFPHD